MKDLLHVPKGACGKTFIAQDGILLLLHPAVLIKL